MMKQKLGELRTSVTILVDALASLSDEKFDLKDKIKYFARDCGGEFIEDLAGEICEAVSDFCYADGIADEDSFVDAVNSAVLSVKNDSKSFASLLRYLNPANDEAEINYSRTSAIREGDVDHGDVIAVDVPCYINLDGLLPDLLGEKLDLLAR